MFPACFAAIDVKRKGRLGRWLNRFAQQLHPCLAYKPPAFAGIAGKASESFMSTVVFAKEVEVMLRDVWLRWPVREARE